MNETVKKALKLFSDMRARQIDHYVAEERHIVELEKLLGDEKPTTITLEGHQEGVNKAIARLGVALAPTIQAASTLAQPWAMRAGAIPGEKHCKMCDGPHEPPKIMQEALEQQPAPFIMTERAPLPFHKPADPANCICNKCRKEKLEVKQLEVQETRRIACNMTLFGVQPFCSDCKLSKQSGNFLIERDGRGRTSTCDTCIFKIKGAWKLAPCHMCYNWPAFQGDNLWVCIYHAKGLLKFFNHKFQ